MPVQGSHLENQDFKASANGCLNNQEILPSSDSCRCHCLEAASPSGNRVEKSGFQLGHCVISSVALAKTSTFSKAVFPPGN